MNENHQCEDCQLGLKAQSVCLPSQGDTSCKLAIWLDSPSMIDDKRGKSFVSENANFVRWCLKRMGVRIEDVYFDYVVKCYPYGGKLPGQKGERMQCVNACSQYRYKALASLKELKAAVFLGSLGCEAMTGDKQIGQRQGAEWEPRPPTMKKFLKHVWIGYSPGIIKEKPSESGTIFRVIWKAAEEAGLQPEVTEIPPYEFDI